MATIRRRGRRVAVGVGFLALVAAGTDLGGVARADTSSAGAAAAPGGSAFMPRDRLGEVGFGSLLLDQGDPDRLLRAPAVATDVTIAVDGIVGRARVRQFFRNVTDGWVEGIYVFPLPENAAVDHLLLRVGDRVVEGRIKEREEARRIYETAKRQGRKAGLLRSARPNIFTTSIANIGPGEEVTVEIEYQQTVRYDGGRFRLRFPMVVGPRYFPGGARTVSFDRPPKGTVPKPKPEPEPAPETKPETEANRIAPPVLHPDRGATNPVRLAVTVDSGFPVTEIASLYHPVTVERQDGHRYAVRLKNGPVAADRDFELAWKPDVGKVPGVALFRESLLGADYMLVMVMPPTAAPATAPATTPATAPRDERMPAVRREVIFVLDTSGSMAGTSIEQAKAALLLAIDRLAAGDRFNIVRFASGTSTLFAEPRPTDAATLARARDYVRWLSAEGGTEMAPAIAAALAGSPPKGYLRQVIFLTDGAVGNEDDLLGLINGRLAASRLFTVGIGSAPNSYFMREAAAAGRGSFTYIGKLDEVRDRMVGLFAKLEHPVLTDIRADWPSDAAAEVSTGILPDLYDGEPLVFTARVATATGVATLTGRRGGRPWRVELPLSRGTAASGVAALWARGRVGDLMGRLRKGGDSNALRAEIVALGLGHRLVTRYTSLVAVDATPARPVGAPLATETVPLNLPHGWNHEKVFGGEKRSVPIDGRDAALRRPTPDAAPTHDAALGRPTGVRLASAEVHIGGHPGLALPRTATAAPLHLLAGILLLALGMLVIVLRRRLS